MRMYILPFSFLSNGGGEFCSPNLHLESVFFLVKLEVVSDAIQGGLVLLNNLLFP